MGKLAKMRFGHSFWLGFLLTQGQRGWTAFCKIFSGIPHLTIFGALKYPPVILYLAYLAVFGHVFERVKYVSWSQVFTKSVSGWLSHTFQILGHWKLFLGKSAIIWLYLPTLLESFQRLDNRKLLPMRLVCFVLIPYRQNDAKWFLFWCWKKSKTDIFERGCFCCSCIFYF